MTAPAHAPAVINGIAALGQAIEQHSTLDRRARGTIALAVAAANHCDYCQAAHTKGPAIFGPVLSEVPDDDDTVALWEHVSWLVRHRSFAELNETATAHPTSSP